MTSRRFNEPAPVTRSVPAVFDRTTRPIIRVAWLIARLLRHDAVRFALYQQRFEKSVRSFHRDLAVLRDAGAYLDVSHAGEYRLICFRCERDAA